MTKIITINLTPVKDFFMSFRPVATVVSICTRLTSMAFTFFLSTAVNCLTTYTQIKNDLKDIWK